MKPLGAAGFPLAMLFGGLTRIRRWSYRTGLRTAHRPPVPVISVGNLDSGGTGKTPAVLWIAEQLQRTGHRPAILSRGYGGSAGKGPVVVPGGLESHASADRLGDEPVLLARRLPGLPVVVGSDRVSGARHACLALGADCLILDDGLQHLRLERDLEVICVNARRPPWRNRLLPAGTLREGCRILELADVILLTRCDAIEDCTGISNRLRAIATRATVLHTRHGPGQLRRSEAGSPPRSSAPLSTESPPRDQPLLAFAGIECPEDLGRSLTSLGYTIPDLLGFPDHHPYTEADLRRIQEAARRAGADGVVTTEKDAMRLEGRWISGLPLWTLGIRLDMLEPATPLLSRMEGLFRGTGE